MGREVSGGFRTKTLNCKVAYDFHKLTLLSFPTAPSYEPYSAAFNAPDLFHELGLGQFEDSFNCKMGRDVDGVSRRDLLVVGGGRRVDSAVVESGE